MPSKAYTSGPWCKEVTPDSKMHGAYMGPTWGRQDPGGSHVGRMILAIWDQKKYYFSALHRDHNLQNVKTQDYLDHNTIQYKLFLLAYQNIYNLFQLSKATQFAGKRLIY